ncbi:macrolide 2'-phosphotransferase [Arthrobacter bambusae]|uniref:macrolide 2'-phosphotransferase n=1 Tax=Arthrobacter bambusae TaxID=1338426 RepID=UPI0027806EE2|nr:macrolide 2'-phosphotransferase [Arthrobacter bambusae]MDQ0030261.1 aminoglycoside phosphotransferase (APT) family kinase protein [Arthrobacter bambusae]MDQ0097943.1 aminoglycoside phosphotransferase (APT) family kinase protein [Arthrobacter bambusae]
MRRTPFELAAVATAAVPGLTPTAAASAPDDAADFDSALLLDSEGKRWRVRSPRHPEASARLETEFMILRAFAPAIRAELPFLMPTVAGTVRQGALSTFVYAHLAGATRSIEELSGCSEALAKEIGAALAAVHDLPQSLVNNADLPSYTANEFRQRKLNELDQAATTGKIPPALLRRWEHALEDVVLWRFNPCVVHGDLHEDNLLIDGDSVTALTGWTDLRIGDPADDFAWLVASNEQNFVESVMRHYTQARRDTPDSHLLRRSALLAEFALAQYLVKALAAGHAEMTAEAEAMLKSLADDIEEQNALAAEESAAAAERAAADGVAAPGVGVASEATASDGGPAKPTVSVTTIPETAREDHPEGRPETASATPSVTVEPVEEAAADEAIEEPAGEPADASDPTPEAASESDDTSTTALPVVESTPLQDAKDH